MQLTEKRLFPHRLPQFKAFKTELPASQGKWIYSMGLPAVRLMVCTEVPGAKGKANSASRTGIWVLFQPLGHYLSQEAGDKPMVLPAAICKVFGSVRCIIWWHYYHHHHHHHHLRLRSGCCWNMGSNGQALLCSSHRVLMAWVWSCHYTALTIILMGCSLFQSLKLILLQLLCWTETHSVHGWGTGAKRGSGCFLKRLMAGRGAAGIALSQILRRTCSLVLVFSGIPRLSCWANLCQFSSLLLFPSPRPSAPLPAPFPTWALLSTLTPLCTWVVAHTLKPLFSSFNNILQLISCFLADSHSKSNLWQVLIWVMTTWSTFLVGNYWVRSEQIWYPLTVSEAGIFTTPSFEIHG